MKIKSAIGCDTIIKRRIFMDNRNYMGKNKAGVIFPVAPNLSEMSDNYLQFIEDIKNEISRQRVSVVLNANSSMMCLYWNIGNVYCKI